MIRDKHRPSLWAGIAIVTLLTLAVLWPRRVVAQRATSQVASAYDSIVVLTGARRPAVAGLDDYMCIGFQHGWVFVTDTAGYRAAINDEEQAITTFEQRFGVRLPVGALVFVNDPPTVNGSQILRVPPAVAAALRLAGAAWVAPQVTRNAQIHYLRAIIEPQNPGFSQLPAQQQEDILESIMKGVTSLNFHEFGHVMFHTAYQVGDDTTSQPVFHRPGMKDTPVPAWLDESAAIVLENETLASQRVKRLHDAWQKDSATKTIVPLDTLFVMKHPVEGHWRAGETVNGIDKEDVLFYEECSALLQFLLTHAGAGKNPPILGAITDGARHGESMTAWLRQYGAHYGLPGTVAGLDRVWRQWLAVQQGRDSRDTGAYQP